MEREERQHLKGVADEVSGWTKRAATLVKERQTVRRRGREAAADAHSTGRPAVGGRPDAVARPEPDAG